MTTAREERDYLRKVAKFAATRRVNTVESGLSGCLHPGSEPMKMFNAAFKQRRLAGLNKKRYGAAKKQFENLLTERLIEGLRGGDLKAAIEMALS
jgi:hypothetical protein